MEKRDDFEARLAIWMDGIAAIKTKYYAECLLEHVARGDPADQNTTPPGYTQERGVKRIRIVENDTTSQPSRRVYAFIDIATGDVLKAESWSKPARHARGNIFDEHNGLGSMGVYGPAYLR